jgi:hypothetical protein
MAAPSFDPLLESFWREGISGSEGTTRDRFRVLNAVETWPDMHHAYATGSWGYTLLRTVYTPESDVIFSEAIERLKLWVRYALHRHRFPSFGERAQSLAVTEDAPHEELWRRFHLDVIEDEEKLSQLDHGTPLEKFTALGEYFGAWVAGVGEDPTRWDNARFSQFLVVDAAALEALTTLPEETPPLRPAVDLQEKRAWIDMDRSAWFWLVDMQALANWQRIDLDYEPDFPSGFRGWMKVHAYDIVAAWFNNGVRWQVRRINVRVREDNEVPGEFWPA